MIEIPRKEIYRYLGYRGIEPDESVRRRTEDCVQKLCAACTPRSIWKVLPLSSPSENVLITGDMEIHSANLYRNMQGCEKAALLAVTIGQGVDLLIRRAELVSMTDAAIYQAAGAAYVEAVCDDVNRQIIEKAVKEGLYCRPRFSPGYGDFSLEHQKDFFRILEITKTIGVNLSDSLLMAPSKSVTAMIGMSRTAKPCVIEGCESCGSRDDCSFRRDT
ncbi:Vitamin B12 dependent methionine synthase, activation domain [Lachnospiraceae bacterium NK3A20]|nr:Vitamin B12 dependent methionine synthase, activation domain [Lachnospiraceae bacterium NK3A20]